MELRYELATYRRVKAPKEDDRKERIQLERKTALLQCEILEVNQVVCYFNYVHRSLNGLGVTLAGDTIGYYSE